MKNKKRIFAALAMSAVIALGVVGFAACEGTAGENGKSAYEIAVDNGFEGTEQEWLDSLKGTGKDGKDGVNGTNGTNGADGKDGVDGTNGKDGNGWHYGNGEPAEEVGKVGDLYLDLENGDVWTKEENGWQKSELNIKGGEQAPEEPAGTAITISANSTADIEIQLEEGVYELCFILDADVTATQGGLTAHVNGSTTENIYDMYEGHNETYYAVLFVRADSTAITLTNTTGEDISAHYTLETYEIPTLKADGTEYVLPMLVTRTGHNYRSLFTPIESLSGTYRITVSNVSTTYNGNSFSVFKNGSTSAATGHLASFTLGTSWGPRDVDMTGVNSLLFRAGSTATGTDYNITVKIEAID